MMKFELIMNTKSRKPHRPNQEIHASEKALPELHRCGSVRSRSSHNSQADEKFVYYRDVN